MAEKWGRTSVSAFADAADVLVLVSPACIAVTVLVMVVALAASREAATALACCSNSTRSASLEKYVEEVLSCLISIKY